MAQALGITEEEERVSVLHSHVKQTLETAGRKERGSPSRGKHESPRTSGEAGHRVRHLPARSRESGTLPHTSPPSTGRAGTLS